MACIRKKKNIFVFLVLYNKIVKKYIYIYIYTNLKIKNKEEINIIHASFQQHEQLT